MLRYTYTRHRGKNNRMKLLHQFDLIMLKHIINVKTHLEYTSIWYLPVPLR